MSGFHRLSDDEAGEGEQDALLTVASSSLGTSLRASSVTSMDSEDFATDRRKGVANGDDASRKQGNRGMLGAGDERVELTEKDDKWIMRKTDSNVLPILVWVYFLQVIDKTTLGYGAVFGLREDANLTGSQYSMIGGINAIAQLAWQPVSSIIIVKIPHRILMPTFILGWGMAQASMGACSTYRGLMTTRFFLGLFEAGCLPLFSVITSHWYRRAEQPLRVAAWYSMNGLSNLTAAGLAYGLGQIQSNVMYPWQIIFLFCGLLTMVTAPFVYWRLPNDISSAKFLSNHEKAQAIERLRANQTGTGTRKFKWAHIIELVQEPKTYLFIAMTFCLNLGAQVSNTFGPLILAGFGFDKYRTSLLNIPFGLLQFITILVGSWAAAKGRFKSLVLAALMLPVVAGIALLYALPRTDDNLVWLMFGFYLFAFVFAGNPLIVSWMIANTAGTTKNSVLLACYQGASSLGNIIGPLLFDEKQAPSYHAGLRAVLGIFVAMVAIVLIQLGILIFLNKLQQQRRVKNGKAAVIRDRSMEDRYVGYDEEDAEEAQRLGERAFLDLTDRENDEFTYVY